ncbi:hypothetical protein LTR53_005183 [Teratosphaeriaceae sp. CCFEE 6253]|nr:hypothetical protein LTR53_005183 [Teratosphaeriaceae sp. CCFEE 6253]
MTPAVPPTRHTWILRFKQHRTTILLHVDPLQKLSAVRAELLKAIQQTNPSGLLNGRAVPESAQDILLARPADSNDLSLGWEPIGEGSEGGLDRTPKDDAKGKGKGKAAVGPTLSAKAGGKTDATDSPQGVGLRDGGVVAFKFRSESVAKGGDAVIDIGEDGDEKALDGETLVGEARPEKWDVVVPTMEETYGDEGAPRIGEVDMGV